MLQKIDLMRQANTKHLVRLKKWQKAWDTLAKEEASGNPDPAVLKLQVSQLSGWAEAFPIHQSDWQQVESQVAVLYQDRMRRYESDLRRACETSGYKVEGEFPTFAVDGLIRVTVNKDQNTASVNGRKASSLSLPVVMDLIREEHLRLWDRAFDPLAFLKKLAAAYSSTCKRKVVSEGEYVYIRDMCEELRTAEKAYPVDSFAADLSRLIEGRSTQYDGSELELAPVRDSRRAVYVYDRTVRSGRYLGLARFRRGR